MERNEKKGITTKVDVELHAKAKQYMAEHGDMNMETFISQAINGLVSAKGQTSEVQKPEKQRTIAFQVPENFYQEVKDYLERNGLRQNRFMYNLIKQELDRESLELETLAKKQDEEQGDGEEENEESSEVETEDEEIGIGMTM